MACITVLPILCWQRSVTAAREASCAGCTDMHTSCATQLHWPAAALALPCLFRGACLSLGCRPYVPTCHGRPIVCQVLARCFVRCQPCDRREVAMALPGYLAMTGAWLGALPARPAHTCLARPGHHPARPGDVPIVALFDKCIRRAKGIASLCLDFSLRMCLRAQSRDPWTGRRRGR